MNLISTNQKIVIFGANGMVGSAIHRLLISRGYTKILAPSKNNLNLLNINDVQKWFDINNPDVIVLAAAKVGGIYANDKYPADFILEKYKNSNKHNRDGLEK